MSAIDRIRDRAKAANEAERMAAGDVEALCDLADHARAFTDATSEGDIDLAQQLERSMLEDLARLDGEDGDG